MPGTPIGGRMRWVRAAASVALVLALCCAGTGPLGATPAAPEQLIAGSATASFTYSVFTGERVESGSYISSGQLGSGRFEIITTTATGAGCAVSDHFTLRARFVRSDGALLSGTVTSGGRNCGVPRGEQLSITLELGSHELLGAQLTLGRLDARVSATPSGGIGVERFELSGSVNVSRVVGYRLLNNAPGVALFGGAVMKDGVIIASGAPTADAQHIELTPRADGYWIVDRDGHVFGVGAVWLGNADRRSFVPGEMVMSLARTPSGRGYWLFTDHGRVEAFGDARFLGDLHALALHAPVVGAAATPTGRGYYLVASDGGVFAFGDARFLGSMGGVRLTKPVTGMTLTRIGPLGYWLVASDGGVFSFHAPFRGSLGALHLSGAITSMAAYGDGYLLAGSDGGVFNFSTNPYYGRFPGSIPLDVVSIAAIG